MISISAAPPPPFLCIDFLLVFQLARHAIKVLEELEIADAFQGNLPLLVEAARADHLDGTQATLYAFWTKIWSLHDFGFEAFVVEVVSALCLYRGPLFVADSAFVPHVYLEFCLERN